MKLANNDQLNISLNTELKIRYKEVAEEMGSTPSTFARKLIRDFVADYEANKQQLVA